MVRSIVLTLVLVAGAGCQYHGRGASADAGDDADGAMGDDVDAKPQPDAPPGTPDAMIDPDDDGDGVANSVDNCPSVANAGQENEDGDDRGNKCDLCPHRVGTLTAGSDADSDGDGIGDQCDPRVGTDRLVVFLGFDQASDLAQFTSVEGGAGWSVSGGSLRVAETTSGDTDQVSWTGESITGTVVVDGGVHVDDVPQPGNSGTRIAAVVGGYYAGSPVDFYACGLRGSSAGAATTVAAWHYVDPPAVDAVMTNPFTGTFSAGAHAAARLWAVDTGADSTLDCWADATTVSASVPGYVPVGPPGFRTVGTSASFDYLFVVDLGP